jgi:branched-chain amino acid transport system ATP-binding protein
MLEVHQLSIEWQGIAFISEATFSVAAREIATLTGPNGCGKSSLLSAIAGLGQISRGDVIWDGQTVTHAPLHRRAGMAFVPEGRQLAPSLSVTETLQLGAGRIGRAENRTRMQSIWERFPILQERRNQPAGTLSGGEAQMLSLSRALMSGPRLLLLDEPTLGLSPAAANAIFQTLAALRAEGMAIILTDQDSTAACALADRVYAISNRKLSPVRERLAPQEKKESPC